MSTEKHIATTTTTTNSTTNVASVTATTPQQQTEHGSLLTASSSEYSLNDGDKALVRMLLEDHNPKCEINSTNIDKYEAKLDMFLKKLTSSTLERMPAETEQLKLDSVAVNDRLKVLAQQNYKTLLDNAVCVSNTFEGLTSLQSRLTLLGKKTPLLLVNNNRPSPLQPLLHNVMRCSSSSSSSFLFSPPPPLSHFRKSFRLSSHQARRRSGSGKGSRPRSGRCLWSPSSSRYRCLWTLASSARRTKRPSSWISTCGRSTRRQLRTRGSQRRRQCWGPSSQRSTASRSCSRGTSRRPCAGLPSCLLSSAS